MITKVSVKELDVFVCSGVNVITGSIHTLNDVISSMGGPLSREKNITIGLISSDFADKKDHKGNAVVIWNRPEKWLHPADMRDIAYRIKALSDSGSQIFVLTTDDLLMSWLSVVAEISTTPLPFKFFNLYEDNKCLCIEEVTTTEHFKHNSVSKSYADLIDFKIKLSMGGLGK